MFLALGDHDDRHSDMGQGDEPGMYTRAHFSMHFFFFFFFFFFFMKILNFRTHGNTSSSKCIQMLLIISEKLVHEMNTPISKTGVYRGIPNFVIFYPKHRLWVFVRIASVRRF